VTEGKVLEDHFGEFDGEDGERVDGLCGGEFACGLVVELL
jgi:hypothetical protein